MREPELSGERTDSASQRWTRAGHSRWQRGIVLRSGGSASAMSRRLVCAGGGQELRRRDARPDNDTTKAYTHNPMQRTVVVAGHTEGGSDVIGLTSLCSPISALPPRPPRGVCRSHRCATTPLLSPHDVCPRC